MSIIIISKFNLYYKLMFLSGEIIQICITMYDKLNSIPARSGKCLIEKYIRYAASTASTAGHEKMATNTNPPASA